MKQKLAILLVCVLCICAVGCAKPMPAPSSPPASSGVASVPAHTGTGISLNYAERFHDHPLSFTTVEGENTCLTPTENESYSPFFELFDESVSEIDEVWFSILDKEQLQQWIDNYHENGRFQKSDDQTPLLLKMITDLNVSKEDCYRAVEDLQSRYLPEEPLYLTNEDIDILLGGDKQKINTRFVSRYAIVSTNKDAKIYAGEWLLCTDISQYEKAGISFDAFDQWCNTMRHIYSTKRLSITTVINEKAINYRAKKYQPPYSKTYTMEKSTTSSWYWEKYVGSVGFIDSLWFNTLGNEKVSAWCAKADQDKKADKLEHTYPHLAQMLYDLEVPESTCRQVFTQLMSTRKPSDPDYLSKEDIEVILTFDTAKINARFVNKETAILANGVVYDCFWLMNHTPQEWKAVGITAKMCQPVLEAHFSKPIRNYPTYHTVFQQKLADLKVLEQQK